MWPSFKIVKVYDARDEVIVRSSNFLICKAAFEKALFVYPNRSPGNAAGRANNSEIQIG